MDENTKQQLKEFITFGCHDVANFYINFNAQKQILEAELIKGDLMNVNVAERSAGLMRENLMLYNEFNLIYSALCNILGEEYVEIYERILGACNERNQH